MQCIKEPVDTSGESMAIRRHSPPGINRCGLLLPDLEGVDTVEQQIRIAMMKGGITPGDDITLHRFEVIRHK